jgi:hypothetical protein
MENSLVLQARATILGRFLARSALEESQAPSFRFTAFDLLLLNRHAKGREHHVLQGYRFVMRNTKLVRVVQKVQHDKGTTGALFPRGLYDRRLWCREGGGGKEGRDVRKTCKRQQSGNQPRRRLT